MLLVVSRVAWFLVAVLRTVCGPRSCPLWRSSVMRRTLSPSRPTAEAHGSVGCLVGVDPAMRDAAALGDLVSVVVGPLAHGLRVQVALRRSGSGGTSAAR